MVLKTKLISERIFIMTQEILFKTNPAKSLVAAFLGYALDAMDWMMLAIALPLIMQSLHLSIVQGGLLSMATLGGAAVGGLFSGIIADYFGRTKTLIFIILWYAVFTAICGFTQSYEQLIVLRVLVGLGLGGEWGVGSALVAENYPVEKRAKATAVVQCGWPTGYGMAVILSMLVIPWWGWRGLFFIGILPAFFTLWIRVSVPEPESWKKSKEQLSQAGARQNFPYAVLFSRKYIFRLIVAIFVFGLPAMGYWGVSTWLPTYLSETRGLNLFKSGPFLILLNVGGAISYLLFGCLADKTGRRIAWGSGVALALVSILVFVKISTNTALLIFSPVLGFCTYGFIGIMGAYQAELFPQEARATALTFLNACSRFFSMFAPYIIGALAATKGMAFGFASTAIVYFISLILVPLLPETRKIGSKFSLKYNGIDRWKPKVLR